MKPIFTTAELLAAFVVAAMLLLAAHGEAWLLVVIAAFAATIGLTLFRRRLAR